MARLAAWRPDVVDGVLVAGWTSDGTLERINDVMQRRVQRQAGRDPEPRSVVIDSLSVKTTATGEGCR